MNISVDLLTVARVITNYEKDATGGTTRWPDTTHYKVTVPPGKRWFVWGGVVNRDASQTVAIWVKDSSDNVLFQMAAYSAATGPTPYPIEVYVGKIVLPIPMDAGTYIEMIFGGAQSTAAYASCIVSEIDI